MKPRLLDLFCGAGGAAMGYSRAGFDVTGIDVVKQPRYPFPFIQADALNPPVRLEDFDVVHASPPCQAYSIANYIWNKPGNPALIEPTRELLRESGRPYVIENVPGAPLEDYVQVCGRALDLGVKRHRWFESNTPLWGTPCGNHGGDWVLVFGGGVRKRVPQQGRTLKNGPKMNRPTLPLAVGHSAMGIDWMNRDELSEAIPPAYTEFVGSQLLEHLRRAA